jgi:hypothetical protein
MHVSPIIYNNPQVLSRPDDWSEHVHLAGYLSSDSQYDWTPPQNLVDFLAGNADPLIYID